MSDKKYLKWYNKIGYGSGDIAGNVVYAFLTFFLMIYLTDTVGLNAGIIGTLMMVSKIFDGITDIFFGSMIDRTKTKFGKARPWMLYAYIGCAVLLVAAFAIPTSWGETAKYIYFFIVYTLLNAGFFTANNIAYGALTALVTRNGAERVQLGTFRFIFATATSMTIQAITVGAVAFLGNDANAWKWMAIIYAIIGIVANTISVFSVKELPDDNTNEEVIKEEKKETKNYSFKQAKIITRIYTEYLAGKSLNDIAKSLITDGIYTPTGKIQWTSKVVLSILSNEKYKGDALLQKTYIVDCISKKMKKNNGELPMYYVENNHPAIIDRSMFDRVQEEISRRNSKRKVKEKGTKTELGKYSSKYALSELLFCGNCGTPYRRVTWTNRGKKKVVWRCISRLDYGTKYCKDSPSLEETALQNAIAEAITSKAKSEGADVYRIQSHLKIYQANQETSSLIAKKNRLAEINKSIEELTNMDNEAAQNGDFDSQFELLYYEMYTLKDELDEIEKQQAKINKASDTLNEVSTIIEGLKNHPVEYNDQAVRQLIHCIKVISSDKIEIQFKDGTMMKAILYENLIK